MPDLQHSRILITGLTPRLAVLAMNAKLTLVFGTTQTPGAFYLPWLLLTDAQAGRHGDAKLGVRHSQPDHRMLLRSSPWFRKPLREAVIHMSVLVPARGRSRMRANYCSCNSSWKHQFPSGHGQPLCNTGLHMESFRWRSI